jgi:hypothetical protein
MGPHADQAAEKVFVNTERKIADAIRRAIRDRRAMGIHFATPKFCHFARSKDFFRSL